MLENEFFTLCILYSFAYYTHSIIVTYTYVYSTKRLIGKRNQLKSCVVLTLTAAPSNDVLEECVLRGDQAPAPPWHPFFLG